MSIESQSRLGKKWGQLIYNYFFDPVFCPKMFYMPLTVAKLRTIKSAGKIERFYDGKGLYLEVTKTGGKYWRFKYAFGGK